MLNLGILQFTLNYFLFLPIISSTKTSTTSPPYLLTFSTSLNSIQFSLRFDISYSLGCYKLKVLTLKNSTKVWPTTKHKTQSVLSKFGEKRVFIRGAGYIYMESHFVVDKTMYNKKSHDERVINIRLHHHCQNIISQHNSTLRCFSLYLLTKHDDI